MRREEITPQWECLADLLDLLTLRKVEDRVVADQRAVQVAVIYLLSSVDARLEAVPGHKIPDASGRDNRNPHLQQCSDFIILAVDNKEVEISKHNPADVQNRCWRRDCLDYHIDCKDNTTPPKFWVVKRVSCIR